MFNFKFKTILTSRTKRARSDRAMMPTIKFDPRWITLKIKEYLRNKIEEQTEFPAEHYDAIFAAGLRFLESGGGLHTFCKELKMLCIDGLTVKRLTEIATYLWTSTKVMIDRERIIAAGIKEEIWMYSGAPCMVDVKHPSEKDKKQDAAHRAANKRRYKIAEGMKINDEWVYPGEEPGCRCSSRIYIPGYND